MEQTKLVSVIVGCGGCGDSDEWTMYECELYINRVGGTIHRGHAWSATEGTHYAQGVSI